MENQLDGFQACLDLFIVKSFPKLLNKTNISRSFLELYFKDESLIDYPKKFKFLLTYNFSKYQNQELPQGKSNWEVDLKNFFVSTAKSCFQALSRNSKRIIKRDIMFWNLLQCKSLSNSVPAEFILQGYEKHRNAMSTPPKGDIDNSTLDQIREFVRPWAKATVSIYKDKTTYPTNHACFENKRDLGGQRGYFEWSKQVKVRSFKNDFPNTRVEPVVIHLEGPPGSGKSRSVEKIAKALCQQFGYHSSVWKDHTYYRSAATDHWDGYRGQLITVLDDFGYSSPLEEDSRKELLQLVSDCDYILPMAELREKGMKFLSKFIIITSNMLTTSIHEKGWSCPDAFFRRVSPCYQITKSGYRKRTFVWDEEYMNGSQNSTEIQSHWVNSKVISGPPSVITIVQEAMEKFHRFTSSEGRRVWNQTILNETSELPGLSMEFSLEKLPPNCVSVYAIAEPLKVRTITKPMAQTFALKPTQLAMFEALKQYPCFSPNNGPDYDLSQLGKPDSQKTFLSGDYTAATDEIDIRVSRAIMEVLAEEFVNDNKSYIADYIRWEYSNHLVSYPPWTKLDPVVQQNGQLMGSLLSFPVLCLANAFTVCQATQKSLKDVPALFHGDDVAAQMTESEIESWKNFASRIGLQLSVGKNYVSKRFVSIDSQLFCLQDGVMHRQITGKFKLVKRDRDSEFTVKDALRNGFTKDQIRKYCHEQLKQSVRSLDVSYTHGGLGLVDEGKGWDDNAKAVYLALLRSKTSVSKIAPNCYRVPKGVQKFLRLEEVPAGTFTNEKDEDLAFETKLRTKVRKILSKLKDNGTWTQHKREFVSEFGSLIPSVDLSVLKTVIIRYDDNCFNELLDFTKLFLPASLKVFLPSQQRQNVLQGMRDEKYARVLPRKFTFRPQISKLAR